MQISDRIVYMTYRFFLTIAITALLFGCSLPDTDEINGVIVFDNNKEYPTLDLKLSDIADIEFVKLEDSKEALLTHPMIIRAYIDDNYILLGDKIPGDYDPDITKVYLFDRQGNYLRTICRGGRGPGELSSSYYDIMVTPDARKILITQNFGDIMTFDFNGNLINYISSDNKHRNAATIGNNILLYYEMSQFVSRYSGEEKYIDLKFPPLRIIDASDFSPIAYDTIRYDRPYNTNGTTSTGFPNLIYGKNGVFVNTLRSDTIHIIDKNLNIVPRVVTIGYKPNKFSGIVPLVEMDNYILFRSQKSDIFQREEPSWQHYIYLKKNKKLYKIPFTDTKNKYLNDEIFLAQYTYTLNYNKHVRYIQYDLFADMQSNPNAYQYYKDFPKNVQAIIDTMNEDSNPIMMIITFKPLK